MNDELTEVRLGRNGHVHPAAILGHRCGRKIDRTPLIIGDEAQVDDLRGRIDPSRYPYRKEGEDAG